MNIDQQILQRFSERISLILNLKPQIGRNLTEVQHYDLVVDPKMELFQLMLVGYSA